MIEKVKSVIYRHEKKENEQSPFYDVVHQFLNDRWNKSNAPLQCLALFKFMIISKFML